jgi:hypothetical protein
LTAEEGDISGIPVFEDEYEGHLFISEQYPAIGGLGI